MIRIRIDDAGVGDAVLTVAAEVGVLAAAVVAETQRLTGPVAGREEDAITCFETAKNAIVVRQIAGLVEGADARLLWPPEAGAHLIEVAAHLPDGRVVTASARYEVRGGSAR